MLRTRLVPAAFPAALLAPLLGACSPALVKFDTGAVEDTNVIDDTGVDLPVLSLSATALDLGYAGADEILSATLVATNASNGVAPLNLAAVVGDGGPHFTVDVVAVTIDPGESTMLTVHFSGSESGTYGGSLDLTSNDPDQLSVSVPLAAIVAIDEDGDGYVAGEDCDDADPDVNPGATDAPYDGVDSDCSGTSDFDADGDGHNSSEYGGDDCDDGDAAISPEADETWYDGVDQDCDSRSDYDQDQDGHDSDDNSGDDCDDEDPDAYVGNLEDPENGIDDDCDGVVDETPGTTDDDGDGFSEATGDCDDTDAAVSPAATETWYDGIDSDCAGDDDYDADGDGYDVDTYGGEDCDDTAADVHPGATDVPYDGVDKDCSGGSDYDADGDGYDSSTYSGTDCNDADASIHPGATEIWYDGINQDCAGASDYDQDGDGKASIDHGGTDCDDLDPTVYPGAVETWYDGVDSNCSGGSDYDADGDGYDSEAYGGTDCDDAVAAVHPSATEVWYDGVDSDCSGGSDYDRDGDGYDSSAFSGTDCADTNAAIHPGATETWYDGVDADCSGGSDYDQDGDGAALGTADCDDTDASIYRAATETCDGKDNDCDGVVDDTGSTWYQDADSDSYGNPSVSTLSCTVPSGYVADNTDCDDTSASTYPGAPELAYDSADNDCDGMTDDMSALAESDWTVIGTSASHAVGASAGVMFDDEDGDGYDELVLPAPADDVGGSNAGALAWHDLPLRGTGVAFTSGYLHVYGESGDDAFGTGFAGLGDVDGYDSGEGEFVTGAAGDDDGGSNAGAVYIYDLYNYSWKTGNQKVSSIDQAKLIGLSAGAYFGSVVATGEIDGDDWPDILVGGYGRSSSQGEACLYTAADGYYTGYLYYDSDNTYGLRGTAAGDEFGKAITTGDMDGDGVEDVVICAPGFDLSSATVSAGGCWVVDPGSMPAYTTTAVNTIDRAQIVGVGSGDGLGSTPGSIDMADVDDDGLDDLAIGVPGYDGTSINGGAVAFFLAGSLSGDMTIAAADAMIEGDGAFGTSLTLGDLDDSGNIGLLAGAPSAGRAGMVYALASKNLQSGGTLDIRTDAAGSWVGEVSSDGFGTTLSNIYDVDGDGTDDFVGGASGWDSGATTSAGKDYVLPLW